MSSPGVSFLVCAFNQEAYVEDAIRGALEQDYSPLEIILSDDASSDGTFAAMERVAAGYRGPHRIILNRNPRNLGVGGHLNRLMELCSGDLVIASAGDDISVPHRASTIVREWLSRGMKPDSIYSAVTRMSPDGQDLGSGSFRNHDRWHDHVYVARHGGCVLGAGHAWTRRMWRAFGPMDPSVVNEDWVLPFRSALLGGVLRIDEPLVRYRVGVSTWHHKDRMKSRGRARRERLRFYFNLAERNARQALVDVASIGRPDLLEPIAARLREAELMQSICESPLLALRGALAQAGGSVRAHRIVLAGLRAWIPGFENLASRRLR